MGSAWPYYRGDVAGTGSIGGGSFDGSLDVIWEGRESGKPSGPLTLNNGALAFPSVRRRAKFFDSETGEYLGKINGKGAVQTGVVVEDSLLCFAVSPRHRLSCFNAVRGGERWRRSVKDASAGSIIVAGRLLVGSGTGRLTAYDLADGSEMWTFTGDSDRFTGPVAYGHGMLFQPGAAGCLYAVSPDDGSLLWKTDVSGSVPNPVAVDDLVIFGDVTGFAYGVDPTDGAIAWRTKVGGPIWTAPAVDNGRAFFGHSKGALVALDVRTGAILWTFKTVDVVRASAVVIGDYVVVGTLAGDLYSLRAADGGQVEHRELDGAIAVSPISDGDRVYVATESGRIFCLGDSHEQTARADH